MINLECLEIAEQEDRDSGLQTYISMIKKLDSLCLEDKCSEYDKWTIVDMSKKVLESIAAKYERVLKGVREVMVGQTLEYEAKTILNKGIAQGLAIAQEITQEITQRIAQGITPEIAQEIAQGITQEIIPGIAQGITQEIVPGIVQGINPEIIPGIAQGKELALVETIRKLLKNQFSAEAIASLLELEPAFVEKVVRVAESYPEDDTESLCKRLS